MTSPEAYPAWNVEKSGEKTMYKINRGHPVIASLADTLDEADADSLNTALSLIESSFPTESLFYEFSNNEEGVSFAELDDDAFESATKTFFSSLKQQGQEEETILSIMRNAEPFMSRWEDALRALGIEEG